MISDTLGFLAAELNGYLNTKLTATSDPRVKVGNVARATDGSLSSDFSLEDKAILTLVNIEEDRVGNWAPLREAVSAGPFVDVNRLLVAAD